MKRLVMMVLLAAHMLLLALPCVAGERQGAFSISPFIGGYSYDGKQHMLTRPVYGLRLGYDLTKSWEVEGVFDYVAGETTGREPEVARRNQDVRAYSYRLDILYNFLPDHTLVPYLAVGGGGTTFEFRDDHENTYASFNFGGGVKYFMTDSIAVRGDVRQLLVFGRDTLTRDDEKWNNWEYSLGMTFLFGGAAPATAAAAMPQPEPVPPPARAEQPPAQEAPPPPVPVTEPTRETAKYCVTLNLQFDIDKAEIRDEYRGQIARVGTFMQKYPSTTAVIEGHADEVGTDEHNMELSQRRAESVVNALVNNFGIDRSRLTAKGYGKTRPIADNSIEEGKQKNRRIEAIIDCALDVKGLTPVPDRICLGLKIQFDTDKSNVKPEFDSELAQIADFMKENPTVTGLVEGHTDDTGSPQKNMRLSQQRAESVMNYLVEKFGIERSRLSAKGYGDTRRVAYNSTPEGRMKNRRVNMILDCVPKK